MGSLDKMVWEPTPAYFAATNNEVGVINSESTDGISMASFSNATFVLLYPNIFTFTLLKFKVYLAPNLTSLQTISALGQSADIPYEKYSAFFPNPYSYLNRFYTVGNIATASCYAKRCYCSSIQMRYIVKGDNRRIQFSFTVKVIPMEKTVEGSAIVFNIHSLHLVSS